MKLYSQDARATMSMEGDDELRRLLAEVIGRERFTHVLETGTFQGLGSTTIVAESFPAGSPPQVFVTIEANWCSWRQARQNLARFPFVRAVWGRSAPVDRCVEFIRGDDFLRSHERYPDIFIDDVNDPVRFYCNEVQGRLGGRPRGARARIRALLDRITDYGGDDLLERHLRAFRKDRPLIVLDSGGGIGLLEFSIVLDVMRADPYTILVHDIHHVKHYRSMQRIRSDSRFRILGESDHGGWAIANYVPGGSSQDQ